MLHKQICLSDTEKLNYQHKLSKLLLLTRTFMRLHNQLGRGLINLIFKLPIKELNVEANGVSIMF